jgi:alanine racemase
MRSRPETTFMQYQPSTRAVIDLAAFRHNLDVVRSLTGPGVKVMAVLKSNAYGHGVRRLAAEAVRCGVDALAVARLGEGCELRAEGIGVPILVCEIVPDDQVTIALRDNLELTAATTEGAAHIGATALRNGVTARVHIKVDTGMGRLGFSDEQAGDAIEAIARMRGMDIAGVFSHFASSEEAGLVHARSQLSRFQDVLADLERRAIQIPLRHMANSGAIINLPESHLDMVRPGLMLYGYTPAREMPAGAQLRPVMALRSRVGFIKTAETGMTISYGRKYTVPSRTHIATIPVGYGDGYSRRLTNHGSVLIRGKRYPTVGSICMDHLMVDIGNGGEVAVGDDVTLIGSDGGESIDCWEIAGEMGTIPYEVTCLITPRVQRVYVDEGLA